MARASLEWRLPSARDCESGDESVGLAPGRSACWGSLFARGRRSRGDGKGEECVSQVGPSACSPGGAQCVRVDEVGSRDVALDSGAAPSVMPAWWCPTYQETTGVGYVAATGGEIADSAEKLPTSCRRLANVAKPLGSVSSLCDEGPRVVFDDEGSCVELKNSGNRIPLRRQTSV